MRVILDTNVLLGALISPYGPPDRIYRTWREGRFELVTSREQLDELRRVSRYPKIRAILPAHRIGTMVNNMHRALVLEELPTLPEMVKVNDPYDAFLLAMALASDADYLVTGDKRAGLLQQKSVGRTRILKSLEFCSLAL